MTEGQLRYPDDLTVRDARAKYFEANDFGEGGYEDDWVKLQAGPVPLYFPNTAARVEAVQRHDVHHVLTGYDTTWAGEAEIGSWEIASGCGRFSAAWILNLQALLIGMLIAPAAVLRGFAWGRRTSNLYHGEFEAKLLDERVGDLREQLLLTADVPEPTLGDRVGLLGWCLVALPLFLLSIAPLVGVIALVVWLVS